MNRSRHIVPIIASTLLACHGVRPTAPRPAEVGVRGTASLRASIDSIVEAPAFRNANWGILVVAAGGDTLYSRNAAKLFMPASNMKLVTTSVALAQLGPDYYSRTTLAMEGVLANGRLDGNLVVIGRGDPSVSDHMQRDAMLPLRAMADTLYAHGVRTIGGRILPAGDAFPDPVLGAGWAWDDLEASYSAATDELLFNEGFSTVVVHAGRAANEPVRVETHPARTFPVVRVMASTVAPSTDSTHRPTVHVVKDTLTGEVVVLGMLAVGDSSVLVVTHPDPDMAYVSALREALIDRGIQVEGRILTGEEGARTDTIAVFDSPPLREVLPFLLKPSQNQMAEMVFKTLGLERGRGGTAAEARRVIEAQLLAWGAHTDGSIVRDGSGLSRYDYLSPETVIHVLDAMRTSPNFSLFYESLPIAGVDGTLRTRMQGTPAEQNVHAKTGSISQARSLSGYVHAADGQLLMFSVLANNWTAPAREVERAQDSIAVRLATFHRH